MIKTTVKIDHKLVNQTEIARRLGISQPYVYQLLTGKRNSQKRLEQILTVLKDVIIRIPAA